MGTDAGMFITADDYEDELEDLDDRQTATEATLAPLPGQVASLNTILGSFLSNVKTGETIATVGGDALVHCTYGAPFDDGTEPVIVVGYGDFPGVQLAPPYVVVSSRDENGFDVAVFFGADAAQPGNIPGEPADGVAVRLAWHAFNPAIIS